MRYSSKKQRGQTLVEFALLIPIFLLLVVGFLDLGRAVYYFSAIHNAAREGARYAVVLDRSDNSGNFTADQIINIKTLARDKAVNVGLSVADIDVYQPSSTPTAPNRNIDVIRVCVNYDFAPITPLIADLFSGGSTIPLNSCSRMQAES